MTSSQPILSTHLTTCSCGGTMAWYGRLDSGAEISLGCTCHHTAAQAMTTYLRLTLTDNWSADLGPDLQSYSLSQIQTLTEELALTRKALKHARRYSRGLTILCAVFVLLTWIEAIALVIR